MVMMNDKINVSFKCGEWLWKDAGLVLGSNRSAFLENHLRNLLVSIDFEEAEIGYGNQTKEERIGEAVKTVNRIFMVKQVA